MIDDETRQRAKEYVDGFAEATADDPKMAKPEPVEEVAEAPKVEAQVSDDVKAFGEAFNAPEATPEVKPDAPAAKPKAPKNFKQAFAQARKDGLKVFEFNGKKFTTAIKSEMKAKPAAAVSAESQQPAPMSDKAKPAEKAVYDGVFPANVIAKVKEKLDDDSQVGKAKFHANGKPNLTAR